MESYHGLPKSHEMMLGGMKRLDNRLLWETRTLKLIHLQRRKTFRLMWGQQG